MKKQLYLWKYNRITGYWAQIRAVEPHTAADWQKIFESDDPEGLYIVRSSKPSKREYA